MRRLFLSTKAQTSKQPSGGAPGLRIRVLDAHILSVDVCLLTRPSRHRRKQSEWSIAQVGQGGLGLPDRDYYYDEDKEEKRKMYKDHISASLLLLGAPYFADAGAADAAASAVYELEKAIAGVHMTRTERRDPEKTYNKMTVADLQAKCDAATGGGGIQFSRLFAGAGKPAETLGDINVSTLGAYMHLSLSYTLAHISSGLHASHVHKHIHIFRCGGGHQQDLQGGVSGCVEQLFALEHPPHVHGV